jgi:hypothetical protein
MRLKKIAQVGGGVRKIRGFAHLSYLIDQLILTCRLKLKRGNCSRDMRLIFLTSASLFCNSIKERQ